MENLINKIQKIKEENFQEYKKLNGDNDWTSIEIILPNKTSYTISKEEKLEQSLGEWTEIIQYIAYYDANNPLAKCNQSFKYKSLENLKINLIKKVKSVY